MIFALIAGFFLGLLPVELPVALLLLTVALITKISIDVRCERMPLINRPSPFLHYCHNLAARGEDPRHAAFSYTLLLMCFGFLAGGGVIALIRWLL